MKHPFSLNPCAHHLPGAINVIRQTVVGLTLVPHALQSVWGTFHVDTTGTCLCVSYLVSNRDIEMTFVCKLSQREKTTSFHLQQVLLFCSHPFGTRTAPVNMHSRKMESRMQ
jgi:hypothetical protein